MANKVGWGGFCRLPLGAWLLLFGLGLALTGCSKSSSGPSSPTLTVADQVAQGWTDFETGNYSLALSEFQAAIGRDASYADAHNGAGWALGKLPSRLTEAPTQFALALQLDTTRYDALGGWAFVAYQTGDWQGALAKSDSLLHRRPSWQFLHEKTLDKDDVRLLQAACYYNLGDYATSFATVVTFSPAFEADVSTPAGRRALFDEIERLRRLYG